MTGLRRIGLVCLGILCSGNAHAQVLTNHQIEFNAIQDFAFDPAYLISGEGGGTLNVPQSIRTHTRLNATAGFGHPTIVDRKSLSVATNHPNPGFLGFEDFAQEAIPENIPHNDATHVLVDISGDNRPDALIADRGQSSLQITLGQNPADGSFQDSTKSMLFDSPVRDLTAVEEGGLVSIGVLHEKTLRVLQTKAGTRNGGIGDLLDKTGEQIRIRGRGARVAAHATRSGALFVVLSEDTGGLRLTTIVADALKNSLQQHDSVLFTDDDSAVEKAVTVAMSHLDDDRLPEVAVLSAVLEDQDNVADSGRLRLFNISSRWRLRLQQQGAADGVVIDPVLLPAQLDRDDCVDPEKTVLPTAMRIADITAVRGRHGPDGRHDIVVGGDVSLLKCDVTRPFAQVWRVDERMRLRSVAQTVVIETFNQDLADNPHVVDLEIARFNSDDLPDVALLDQASNGLIVLRQQPQPCITFITAITHGHQGTKSIMAEAQRLSLGVLGDGTVEPVPYNNEYNAMLSDRVDGINQARRTPDPDANPPRPELCPTAHIAVNGHWEQATSNGALGHVVGRAGWILSSLVPSPTCFLPLPALPHPEPIGYWLSAFWLLVPPPPVNIDVDCLVPLPNYGSRAQFFLAGVGGATEWVSLMVSGAASRTAATDLATTIDRAVRIARRSMDTCTGQIALDTVGFSRGTAVTSATMQQVNITPLSFNADASIIYLDAIDPSWGPTPPVSSTYPMWFNGDSIRPWAKSGYFVNDPLVITLGSARISSVFADRPDLIPPSLDPTVSAIQNALNPMPPALAGIGIYRDIVGLPSGYDRTVPLGLPTGGWFARGVNLTHGGVRMGLIPAPSDPPQTPPITPAPPEGVPTGYASLGGPPPTFANATHIGAFLLDPLTPVPDFPGWRRNAVSGFDDSAMLPDECQTDGGSDGQDDVDNDAVADASQDEFVADPEFNLAHGIVANSRDLIELTEGLSPDNKDYFLNQLIPGDESKPIRQYITAAAEKGLPPGEGVGSWSAPANCSSCPHVVSDGDESRLPQFRQRLSQSLPLPSDGDDAQGIEQLNEAWVAASTNQNNIPDGDRMHLYGLLAAGGTRLDDAQLVFGASAKKIVQHLLPASRHHNRLIVRVFYKRASDNGVLEVTLKGGGLNVSKTIDDSAPGKLTELLFEAERIPTSASDNVPSDSLLLTGRDVNVSAISVKPYTPWNNPNDGRHYEIIHLPQGVDWQAAYNMAKRKSYDGKVGQLAEFPDNDAAFIGEVLKQLNARHPVWLGARGETGDVSSLQWLSGNELVSVDIDNAFEAELEKRSYVFAHPDGKLASSGLRATVQGKAIGLLVAY